MSIRNDVPKKILFLCTGNSARSQMAEGLTRHLGKGAGGSIEALSAGLAPKGVHPLAVAVMDEVGIDIRGQRSKEIGPSLLNQADWIITLCGNANARCPASPSHIHREHWPIDDPAMDSGSREENLSVFREKRDELKERILQLLKKV
ncbi:MAG: arsenate reductase ArsC [Nitrospiria bacterium]